MRKIKYIRTQHSFIIFAEPLTHKEIANGFEVISAGFCYWVYQNNEYEWKCYGESVSLNLKSLEEDSSLLTKQLNNEY